MKPSYKEDERFWLKATLIHFCLITFYLLVLVCQVCTKGAR